MLHVHRSEQAGPLVGALVDVLGRPLDDPFASEVVAVPARGMERWLTQQLSHSLGRRPGGAPGRIGDDIWDEPHGDGVAAAIEFPFPERLLSDLLALASDIDPDTDPWRAERLVWPLIAVTEAALDERWIAPLAVHLRPPAGERRFSRLQELARLLHRYATYRPQLVRAWLNGADTGAESSPWQPELLRRLAAATGVPNPAERLGPACERLRDEPSLVELPERLALFGITRLPQSHLELLQALAAHRDVHLMALHPSPVTWERGLRGDGSGRAGGRPGNRLLASWGRESAAMAEVLAGERSIHHPPLMRSTFGSPAGSHTPPERQPVTLLSRIQEDIQSDTQPPGPPLSGSDDRRFALDSADQSIRIHACHGRARQVEVLREAILHRLQRDPTLEPRDVIVMCPNVEEFAPLIEAAFEGGELPIRLADRSLRQTNPVLSVAGRLLEFPSGRVTASEVLDLADTDPVRRRFGFRDDDLAQLREWAREAEIHWGLSASAREPFKLAEIDAGTWAAGLRRLMLAVALDPGEGLYGGTLPTTEVDSGTITLAGRVAEFAGRLQAAVRSLQGPQTAPQWAQALSAAADALTATTADDAWQRRELDLLIDDMVAGADDPAGTGSPTAPVPTAAAPHLTLPELRALLGDRLQGRPTRANFRTGQLTVCTLAPMRSVPHRVICLLGLDDGIFPRVGRRDGDDVLLADPQPGDRDPRAEDRQLLLDALLAAQDALIITYTGNDERTNAPRPPAVPVGELLDMIDATARVAVAYGDPAEAEPLFGAAQTPLAGTAEQAREHVLVQHPLQSFDPRNFSSGARSLARDGQPWSFDAVALEGALALDQQRLPQPAFLPEPLPPADEHGMLALDDLIRFAERPVRAFLRQRLGISLVRSDDEISDSLPVQLDPLQKWAVGQRLLEALSSGVSGRDACLAELARGTLPPGNMARAVLAEVYPRAERLAVAAASFGGGSPPRSLEANVQLEDGTRITGTVSGVRDNMLLTVSYSRLNPRHRIAAWVRLLALTAAHPEIPFEAVTVARARGGGQRAVEVARLPALGGDRAARAAAARAELQTLVQLRSEGMMTPLPLPPESGFAYAQAKLSGGDPRALALEAWNDRFVRSFGRIEGEHARDENPVVLGPELDFARLDELAPRLWAPLLAREQVEHA